MNALQVGQRLVELTRADNDAQALDELYADSVVSVEAGENGQIFDGIAAVREKHAWWNSVATIHDFKAEGPYAAADANQFVVRFETDLTMQDQPRAQMSEVGVFEVADGKIVRETYLALAE